MEAKFYLTEEEFFDIFEDLYEEVNAGNCGEPEDDEHFFEVLDNDFHNAFAGFVNYEFCSLEDFCEVFVDNIDIDEYIAKNKQKILKFFKEKNPKYFLHREKVDCCYNCDYYNDEEKSCGYLDKEVSPDEFCSYHN